MTDPATVTTKPATAPGGSGLSKWLLYVISVIVLLVAYPLLISTWITAQVTPTLATKDYLFLVQITLTFLATVGIGILTVANARSTIELQAYFTQTVNNATETLKAQLTRDTEDLKTRLGQIIPKEHEAYHALWKAADGYFRALQDLEVGVFSDDKLKRAEEYSENALGKSLLTTDDDRNEYYVFLGEVDVLRNDASRLRGDPEKLKKLWAQSFREIGASYEKLRGKLTDRVRGTAA